MADYPTGDGISACHPHGLPDDPTSDAVPHHFYREVVRERVRSLRDAYLASPDLDGAWIAGWHAAIDHAAHVLAQPATTEEVDRG